VELKMENPVSPCLVLPLTGLEQIPYDRSGARTTDELGGLDGSHETEYPAAAGEKDLHELCADESGGSGD
jgi:hypothetical protein